MFSFKLLVLLIAIFVVAAVGHKEKKLKGGSSSAKSKDHYTSSVCDGSGGDGGHSPPICGHDKSPTVDELVSFLSYEGLDKISCCLKCTENYPSCVCYTDDPSKCILYSEK